MDRRVFDYSIINQFVSVRGMPLAGNSMKCKLLLKRLGAKDITILFLFIFIFLIFLKNERGEGNHSYK